MIGSMRDFITAEIDEHYIYSLKKYYVSSGDKRSKIVDFSSGLPSPFLAGSEYIGIGKENFCIIDSFDGIKPFVFDYNFLVEGNPGIHFLNGIALDSQVVSYLHNLVMDRNGSWSATPRGHSTQELLRRLASYSLRGWDFNAFFYIMEACSKNSFNDMLPYARSFGETMLRLQTMDDEEYIKTGKIIPDPEKMEEYAERHRISNFYSTSESIINSIIGEHRLDEIKIHIQAIYAALLKIGLINLQKYEFSKKSEILFDFFHNELGVFLLRESILACLHFAGKSGKLIPVQPGAKKIRRNLLASAWDLFLLRLPESLIVNETNEYTSIYYVCTAEKALQKLGRMFVVKRVTSLREGRGKIPSSVGFRADLLSREVGEAAMTSFFETYTVRSRIAGRVPKTFDEMKLKSEMLENEIAKFASL